jgi:hypothetical protein
MSRHLLVDWDHPALQSLPCPWTVVCPRPPQQLAEALEGLRGAFAEDPDKGVAFWVKEQCLSASEETVTDLIRCTKALSVHEMGDGVQKNLYRLDTAYFFLTHAEKLIRQIWLSGMRHPIWRLEAYFSNYWHLHKALGQNGVPVSRFCETAALRLAALDSLEVFASGNVPLAPEYSARVCEALWCRLWLLHTQHPFDPAPQEPGPVHSLPEARNALAALIAFCLKNGAAQPYEIAPVAASATKERSAQNPATVTVGQPDLKCYLTNWGAILTRLNLKNNREEKGKVKRLNEKYDGPIKIGKKGEQPWVELPKLLNWWQGLEEEVQRRQQRQENAEQTLRSQHFFGRLGTVLPEISGHIQERRNGKHPLDSSPT